MIFLILFWMKLHNYLQATNTKNTEKFKSLRVIQVTDFIGIVDSRGGIETYDLKL